MADMVKVKDFAKNFGLDIKDATKIIEDSGLLGSTQVGETVEMSVINTIVNKITLDNQTKISDYLAGGTKKAEKPAEKKEKPEKYYTTKHIVLCLVIAGIMAAAAGVFAGLYFSAI